jgi:hypothetical protein
MDKINSSADNAFDNAGDSSAISTNMNVDVGLQAPMPRINTVADDTYADTPGMSGSQALSTVKSVNLPDSDETKINSAV